MAAFRLT